MRRDEVEILDRPQLHESTTSYCTITTSTSFAPQTIRVHVFPHFQTWALHVVHVKQFIGCGSITIPQVPVTDLFTRW